jgi:hypothetical protein
MRRRVVLRSRTGPPGRPRRRPQSMRSSASVPEAPRDADRDRQHGVEPDRAARRVARVDVVAARGPVGA